MLPSEDPKRRLVMQLGLGACALPLIGTIAQPRIASAQPAAMVPVPVPALALDGMVLDTRQHGGDAWAMAWQQAASRTHRIEGDVTALWRDGLDTATRAVPLWLGGVTAASALSCLALLTADRRMHVGLRIEHLSDQDGAVAYAIDAPRSALRAIAARLTASGDASGAILQSMALAAAGGGPMEHATVRAQRALPIGQRDSAAMTAWLLRPARSA